MTCGKYDKIIEFITIFLDHTIRSTVKRWKERNLEDAAQVLRKIPEPQLRSLGEDHLLLLVRLLLHMQLEMANISIACRKLDQVSPSLQSLHVIQPDPAT